MTKEHHIKTTRPDEFRLEKVREYTIPVGDIDFQDSRRTALLLLGAEVTVKSPDGVKRYIITHTEAYGQDAGHSWRPLNNHAASDIVACKNSGNTLATWKTGETVGTACVLIRGMNLQLDDGRIQMIDGPAKVAKEWGFTEAGQAKYVTAFDDGGQPRITLGDQPPERPINFG